MKKTFLLITLAIFCLTTPVISNESPPVENSDAESPNDLTSPVYATDSPPFRDRTDDIVTSPNQKYIKATAAVIGTLAAITIGLIVSGANTGKRTHTPKES